MDNDEIEIYGIEASPYSVKLRAFCRYRPIKYRWISRMPQFHPQTSKLKPSIMPAIRYSDGHFETDSTPIITALDRSAPAARSVFLKTPALNFLNLLIEDFADEWLVKSIFHYRFTYADDRAFGPRWVMDDAFPDIDSAELSEKTAMFLNRQTERMPIVGCTPDNKEIIEWTYHETLNILEPFVALERFLFGSAPSLADFGLFGVLKTLATDPTPMQIMRDEAPRLDNWIRRVDDLSGVDGTLSDDLDISPTLTRLITVINETYLPYLRANAEAYAKNENTFSVTLKGHQYQQSTFKYQVKCLDALQSAFDALSPTDRQIVTEQLKVNFSS